MKKYSVSTIIILNIVKLKDILHRQPVRGWGGLVKVIKNKQMNVWKFKI